MVTEQQKVQLNLRVSEGVKQRFQKIAQEKYLDYSDTLSAILEHYGLLSDDTVNIVKKIAHDTKCDSDTVVKKSVLYCIETTKKQIDKQRNDKRFLKGKERVDSVIDDIMQQNDNMQDDTYKTRITQTALFKIFEKDTEKKPSLPTIKRCLEMRVEEIEAHHAKHGITVDRNKWKSVAQQKNERA